MLMMPDKLTGSWQDIATAPKDGSRIIGYGLMAFEEAPEIAMVKWSDYNQIWQLEPAAPDDHLIVSRETGEKVLPEPCILTRWMPLPPAPSVDPYGPEARNRLLKSLHGSVQRAVVENAPIFNRKDPT